jgi:hypothetical protein
MYIIMISQYNMPYTEGYACKLQFEVNDDYINLEFDCRGLTIEQLESKVEWLFTTLGAEDMNDENPASIRYPFRVWSTVNA